MCYIFYNLNISTLKAGRASTPFLWMSGPLCLCNETDRDGPVISVADGNRLLKEEMRTWLAKKESLAEEADARA